MKKENKLKYNYLRYAKNYEFKSLDISHNF